MIRRSRHDPSAKASASNGMNAPSLSHQYWANDHQSATDSRSMSPPWHDEAVEAQVR